MLRVKRAMGAVTIAALTMTGLAVAGPPAAEAGALLCTSLRALAAPVVGGTGAVGEPLTITSMPTWSCELTSAPTVQWYDDAGPVAGATGATYTPTAAEAGGAVIAVVTGQVLGLLPVSVSSNAVPVPAVAGTSGGTGTGGTGSGSGTGGTPVDTPLDLTGPLSVTGTPAVGQLLAVAEPQWNLPGVMTAYQWLRDGAPISGATGQTYVPALADAGHTIVVRVVGSLTGLADVTRLSDPLAIPTPDVGALPVDLVQGVSVPASAAIGTVLSATPPAWNPADAVTTYQWLRDGAPIPGATDPTCLLRAVDYGHAISVSATGELVGWLASTVPSNAVEPALGAAVATSSAPRITGTPRVGRLLTADPGTWTGGDLGDPDPPAYSYQWLRDDTPIDGAVAQTYQASRADIGSALTVAVTAVRAGYAAGDARSAAVSVAKLRSTLSATLASRIVRKAERAVVGLRLRVPGIPRPTGAVTVLDGRRVVGKGAFARRAGGALSLRIARLAPGTHRIKAVYGGTRTVAASSARVVRLTVRR